MTWECDVDDYSKGIYHMILGRYLLIEFLLNPKLSKHAFKRGDETLKGSTAPMIDLVMYRFKDLNTGEITSKEYFMN